MQTTHLRGPHDEPMPTSPAQTDSGALHRMLAYLAAAPSGPRARRVATTLVLLAGAALVLTTGAIHLHLWAAGYKTIPTIGPLFLFQGVAGAVLGVAVVVTRRLLTVVAGAGFLVATIGGLLLSVYVGLFGFMDTLAAPFAGVTIVVESVGTVVLALGAVLLLIPPGRSSTGVPDRAR